MGRMGAMTDSKDARHYLNNSSPTSHFSHNSPKTIHLMRSCKIATGYSIVTRYNTEALHDGKDIHP